VAHVWLLRVVIGEVEDVGRHIHERAAAAVHDDRVEALRDRPLAPALLPGAELLGGNHLPRINRLDGHGSSSCKTLCKSHRGLYILTRVPSGRTPPDQ